VVGALVDGFGGGHARPVVPSRVVVVVAGTVVGPVAFAGGEHTGSAAAGAAGAVVVGAAG
jgi:hypothetical protein